VWTVSADFHARHPAEVRRFARDGGAVRIVHTSHAEVEITWQSADPPAWAELAMPDDRAEIEQAMHRERSAARRAAWQRRWAASS
jgi:hypothetical protein